MAKFELDRVIENTDWDLLRKQKLTLIDKSGNNDICGILNFIDALQDALVEDKIVSEEEMFGKTE